MARKLFLLCLILLGITLNIFLTPNTVQADALVPPWQAADAVQDALFQAQVALLGDDVAAAETHLAAAQTAVADLGPLPTISQTYLDQAFNNAHTAVGQNDSAAFAGARGQIQGAIYWASYLLTRQAILDADQATAQQWLLVRDFRPSTRFSRPGADATLAVRQLDATTIDDTIARLEADLLDTYQALLSQHLALAANGNELPNRRAESAGLAQTYWHILAPSFIEQQGAETATAVTEQFDQLLPTLLGDDEQTLSSHVQLLNQTLQSFRAAPLSPAEQARRAGQMLRFLSLVPVEYGRGVKENTVMIDFEVQEAVTFMGGAQAAFADLRLTLDEINAEQTAVLAQQINQVVADLEAANYKTNVITPQQMQTNVDGIYAGIETVFPPAWLEINTDADFDVLASVLDQMQTAVRAGDYKLAESARLEAYAIFDFGPEPRLLAFAPPLVAEIDGLFWQGYNGTTGLGHAIALEASASEVAEIRTILDDALTRAQLTLGDLPSAPGAIILNAAIIVFREGLESVVILAALMASLVGAYAHYRRPMVLGVILSLVATAFTWFLAQQVLSSLTRFGEKLEAIVSLIAIGVLLLITNWFFHKAYWKDWMAGFHTQKRQLLNRETGQFVGLMLLGFTSMYREGFETVLFLQALVLDAGPAVVLQGVAFGSLAVIVVGMITFKVQARLPYKKMLVWTGVLIGAVLMTMVGKTIHVMQAVGWMGITPVAGLQLPYQAGLWFGVYSTWQGIIAQLLAAVFVIGSYYLAEYLQKRKRPSR